MRKLLGLLVVLTLVCNCSKEDDGRGVEVEPSKSKHARLVNLVVEVDNSIYPLFVEGIDKTSLAILPPSTDQLIVREVEVSTLASTDIAVGDVFSFDDFPISVEVTAEDEEVNEVYEISLTISDEELLVHQHGRLKTNGNKIVNKHDNVVSFAGNSFFWSNDGWGSEEFYNASVVSWLVKDWNTKIVRAALGVDENGGYLENKEDNQKRIETVVEAAIKEGIYVIIDWHSHHAEEYKNDADMFFLEMASKYGKYENVIFEIYNEPLEVSWDDVLKPYATQLISSIRSKGSENLIVVGTPTWSQRVDLASASPITGYENIVYCLHFYTVHHQKWLRDKADIALSRGVALFITEWGSLGYTQDDPELELWMEWCRENDISHCNWAVNDKQEEWSIVKPGTDPTGNWGEDDLTEAGKLAKSIISNWAK